jgi:hypothetical protein
VGNLHFEYYLTLEDHATCRAVLQALLRSGRRRVGPEALHSDFAVLSWRKRASTAGRRKLSVWAAGRGVRLALAWCTAYIA